VKFTARFAAGVLLCACAVLTTLAAQAGPAAPPLQLLGRTALAGYEGDFDHLAADPAGHRLFLAGEDGGTLEVFDLA